MRKIFGGGGEKREDERKGGKREGRWNEHYEVPMKNGEYKNKKLT